MADGVNLVDQLDTAELSDLGGRIKNWVEQDLESRQEWEQSQVENFELWMMKPSEPRIKDGSTIALPMLASAVNNWSMLTESAMFDNPSGEFVRGIPTEPNDVMRAERAGNTMSWQLRVEQEGDYESSYSSLLPHTAITGMGFKKIIPNVDEDEERDFDTFFVSSLDCIVPNDTKSLKTARRVTHRFYQHLDDIKDDADAGFFDKNQVELLEQPATDQADEKYPNPMRRSERQKQGVEDSHESAEHTLYETHFRGILKEGGERKKWIVTATSTGVVLRITEHPKRIKTMFAAFRFLDSPEGGFYAYGFAHFVKPLNIALNGLFRQYMDAGTLSNLPFYFYGRAAGLRGRQIEIGAGEGIEVDDVSQILVNKFPGVDQNLPILIEFVMRFAQDITANTDEMQGRAQKGVREPTVRGQVGRVERALTRFKGLARRIFRGQEDELRIIFDLNSMFLAEEKQYQILGSNEGVAFGVAHRSDFEKRMHIRVTGDPDFASAERQQARAEAALNLAFQHPEVISPATGEVLNPNFLRKVTDDFLRTIGKPELTRYTPNATSPMVDPYAENMLFAQGDTIDPKPVEDHITHITVHTEFRGTDIYESMSQEAKDAHDLHIVEHDTMMTLVAQQQEAAANVQGPNGPGTAQAARPRGLAQPPGGQGLRAIS